MNNTLMADIKDEGRLPDDVFPLYDLDMDMLHHKWMGLKQSSTAYRVCFNDPMASVCSNTVLQVVDAGVKEDVKMSAQRLGFKPLYDSSRWRQYTVGSAHSKLTKLSNLLKTRLDGDRADPLRDEQAVQMLAGWLQPLKPFLV